MQDTGRAVIFDLDGTLVNSLDDLADAVNEALAAQGFSVHPTDAYRFFVGDGMETLVQRALPQDASPEAVRAVAEDVRRIYSVHWARKSRPYAGILAVLKELCAAGLPVCVLSNKPHEFTELVVQRFFPDIPFRRVLGSPPGGKAKPEPRMALGIAEALGVRPDAVWLVGDSRTDMDTAAAAGMVPVGVLWGFRPKEELERHGARYLVEHPADLPALLLQREGNR